MGTFTYNLRFPGQYYDAEKGSNYNYFRDYDPVIGRYVESDPIGLKGGLNTYSYSALNPLDTADPDGRCYIVPLPNGIITGRDEFWTGSGNWQLLYPIIQGPEKGEGAAPGIPLSTYECVCARARKVDWRYYWQARVRIVEICLTCAHPHVSERDDLGPKHYYRTQSLDFQQRKIPGGISVQSEPVMELDCEEKCSALNHR